MTKPVPLAYNWVLRECILLSQQMRPPIFPIGVSYTGNTDFSSDTKLHILIILALAFDVF